MHIIIGCGYVGEIVADLLHAAGEEAVAVTHSAESCRRLAETKPYAIHSADLTDLGSLRSLADRLPGTPTAILHCASSSGGGAEMYQKVYVEGCANLYRAWSGVLVLFTSSTSVYPQTDGSIVTEESDASPERATSQLLRKAEDLVLQSGGCVARLAGIYGPGRSFVLKSFLEGTASIEGNGEEGRMLNQIHRADAGSALAHLMIAREAGIWNVVDDEPLTQRECFTALARRFGGSLPLVTPAKMDRKRAWTHKRIVNHKLRSSGWQPRYPGYLEALDKDPELVPSVLAQVTNPTHAESPL